MTEPGWAEITATCRTADCPKAGQEVPGLLVPEDPWPPNVVCGVCGQPITDIAGGPGGG